MMQNMPPNSYSPDFSSSEKLDATICLSAPTAATTNVKKQSPKSKAKSLLDGLQSVDVLCGRDKMSHAHSGNKRFRQIIERHRESYQTASCREKKTSITCQIVKMIRDCEGRFLKRDDETGEWSDVGDDYAREKVSHALRSAKDPNRPKIKKTRVVPKFVPSPEQEAIFRATLRDQQRIFQSLVEKENQGLDAAEMFDHGFSSEDIFSSEQDVSMISEL
jgi:hypothetical protein